MIFGSLVFTHLDLARFHTLGILLDHSPAWAQFQSDFDIILILYNWHLEKLPFYYYLNKKRAANLNSYQKRDSKNIRSERVPLRTVVESELNVMSSALIQELIRSPGFVWESSRNSSLSAPACVCCRAAANNRSRNLWIFGKSGMSFRFYPEFKYLIIWLYALLSLFRKVWVPHN